MMRNLTFSSPNALFSGFLFLLTALSSAIGAVLKSATLGPLMLTYTGIVVLLLILLTLDKRLALDTAYL